MTTDWIRNAIADAGKQAWAASVNFAAIRSDLEDWSDEGMFKNEKQVRDQLCRMADAQLRQIGRPNFRCSI